MGITAFLFGIAAYAFAMGVLVYAIGFIGNLVVPKSIDSGLPGALPGALIVDLLLLGLFAVQHSVMARQGFKAWWTRFVPHSIERSVYVLLSGLALALLFWKWQPLGGSVWSMQLDVTRWLMHGLYALG